MTLLAVALIAAGLVGFAIVLRHEIRTTRPTDGDYLAEDLLDQQDLDRLVNAAVLEAHRAYYRENAR